MNSPYIKKVLKLDENKNISELYFNGVFSSASLFPIIISFTYVCTKSQTLNRRCFNKMADILLRECTTHLLRLLKIIYCSHWLQNVYMCLNIYALLLMFHKEIEFNVSENHRADEAIKLPLSLRIPVCIPLTTQMKIRSKSYNDKGPEQTHLNFNLIDNAIRTNHFKASCCFLH